MPKKKAAPLKPAPPARGGKRPGAGRKASPAKFQERSLSLTPEQWAWLASRGKATLGEAMRSIIQELMDFEKMCHGYSIEECRDHFFDDNPQGYTVEQVVDIINKDESGDFEFIEEQCNMARYQAMLEAFDLVMTGELAKRAARCAEKAPPAG